MMPSGVKVYLSREPVDFRKGPDNLLSLVRDAGSDPFSGALYMFRAKRADRIKIVWWDGSGVCLFAKRLEKSAFCWPRIGPVRVPLNHAQLMALLEDLPEHAGKQKVLIGENVSARLDVIPAKFRVIVTRRPRYAFKGWDGVIQALAPAHIIESGLPTQALLAQIAVSKYADGLPLFRQEGIYARDGVEIDRPQMAQWMGRVGFELEILVAHVLGKILKGSRVFADETSLPTLAPGTSALKKDWLWADVRDDSTFGGSGPPMVACRFEDDRSGECVRRHLGDYGGILQVDGYAAYNQLVRKDGGNDGPRLAGC